MRRALDHTCRLLLPLALVLAVRAEAQQVADLDFNPPLPAPAYASGKGPVVLIDSAHHNFHTMEGRFAPFAHLLERDGYVVRDLDTSFTDSSLAGARVLVISNALAAQNEDDWFLPTPSAFSREEIAAVERWVDGGGSLFLIADHMPFPGAASDLAARFGFLFGNGFAVDIPAENGQFTFRRADASLGRHSLLEGRHADEQVDSVTCFMGQAFRVRSDVDYTPLLILAKGISLLLPEEAWMFSKRTPRIPADGMLQGAILRHGQGRVAAFGEAAMFTAQVSGPQRSPMGMNHPQASQNAQFLLNVMHWLTGLIEP